MNETKRPMILLIEDDRSLADVMAFNLQREGYEVSVAEDGPAGADRAAQLAPSLIILERMLPGGDGVEFCRELRTRAETAEIPILMLVDQADEFDRELGLALNIVDFLAKPFGIKELMQRVGSLLSGVFPAKSPDAVPDDEQRSGGAKRQLVASQAGSMIGLLDEKRLVLFLCTGNSARSQMAEAFLRRYGAEHFEACSAGLAPRGIHPLTAEVMREIGVDLSGQRSKSVGEYLGKVSVHHAVIVCRKVEPNCPTMWPFALSQAYWPFDDPTVVEGSHRERLSQFRAVRDQIDVKIRAWLTEQGITPQSPSRSLTV